MERLTNENHRELGFVAYVGAHNPFRQPITIGELALGPDVDYSQKKILRDVFDRLAAYEDTGMEPEQVAELAHASKDGRLVVLPCDGSKDTALLAFRNNETEIANVRLCGNEDEALALLSYLAHFVAGELGTTYQELLLSMGNRPSIVEVAETEATLEQKKGEGKA